MSGNEAAERHEARMQGIDRAAARRRRDHGKQRGHGGAEADFLAFHVAAIDAKGVHQRVARGLRPVRDGNADDEDDTHGTKDGPALALVADHAAEDVGQRRTDGEDRHHLDQVDERIRVLERMGRIGIEEAAAVRAQHLDRELRRDRPDGDRLLGAFQRRRIDVGRQGLRNAACDIDQRQHHAERQKHVEGCAGHVGPEVADALRRCAREAANESDRECDARGGRHEVLHRQAGHLHQIGHGALAAVVLPVRVGHEAGGGVEGEVWRHRAHAHRIVRQHGLEALEGIEHDEAEQVEGQQGQRIGQPVLLFPLARAGQAVEHSLDRAQERRKEGALAVEDARHVPAQGLHERDDDGAEDEDLDPAVEGHSCRLCQNRSGRTRA